MNKDLESYYEARFDMMTSQGWIQLLEDAKIMRDNYSNITSIASAEELHFRKGQLDILDWLTGLKDISERAYEELQNEKDLHI